MYDRYVSNKILTEMLRPQAINKCSITAMATAVNAVFGTHITVNDVLAGTGWKKRFVTMGRVGNQTMLKGLQAVCGKYELSAEADVFLNTIKNSEQNWKALKEELRNQDSALIYHMRNHYTLLAGYFEEPTNLGWTDGRNWLIIAEASLWWRKPMRLVKWPDVAKDLHKHDNHLLIRLRKACCL